MQIKTSAQADFAASTAQITLTRLSLDGRSEERWLPVKIIGIGVQIIKEIAAAVYCIVSVPCMTMIPSTPASISSNIAFARSCQIDGVIFSDKILATIFPR